LKSEPASEEHGMETPKRMGLAETLALISNYLTVQCRLEGGDVKCVNCGGKVRRVRAFMSLHDERFGDACIGPGRAWRMEIPYCPACEEPPSLYGCIHMSEPDLNLPSVVEASRPFGKEHPEYRKTTDT
jgi:NAD-dependent SIR2 family protein deacetylase